MRSAFIFLALTLSGLPLSGLPLSGLPLLVTADAFGATIWVGNRYYVLDNGVQTDNPWDVYEEVAYNKDAAIVVMRAEALQSRVNDLLKTFEKMNIPVVFTKEKDYPDLIKRGILVPTKLPKK